MRNVFWSRVGPFALLESACIWLRDLHSEERNATRLVWPFSLNSFHYALFLTILPHAILGSRRPSHSHALVSDAVAFGVFIRYALTIAACKEILSNVDDKHHRLQRRSRMMLLLVILLSISYFATASPSVNLPVNAQVPPVAIVDQAYKFTFSTSTFTSTAGPLNYTLGNCPSWLQLNGSARTFYGTPGSNGVGPGEVASFVVDLIATDETGPTTMPVTFVTTADPGPQLGISIAAQLPAFGAFSNPDTLILTPGAILSLTFSPTTFVDTNEYTKYYVMCANNTPLPSWINFDPSSLTFSGITPSATSPSELPQNLSIQVTASEITGFSQAVTSFKLVIESHVFVFGNTLQIINATVGSAINFTSLHDDLALNGQPIQESDLAKVVSNAPSWLSLSNGTLVLSGTAPANQFHQNFTVTATDKYGDSASTVVLVQIVGNASTTLINPIATLSATIGTDFTFGLNSSLPSMKDVNVTVDFGTASAWLEFNPHSLMLYGHVPSNLKPQTVQFNVTGTQGSQSQSQIININVVCKDSVCPVASGNSGSSGNTVSPKKTSSKRWVAAAVILPLTTFAGLLILCCCCRKRKWKIRLDLKSKKTKVMISRPIFREKESLQETRSTYFWGQKRNRERLSSSETSGSPKTTRAQDLLFGRNSRFPLSKAIGGDEDRSPRPDSWQRYVIKIYPSRRKHPEAVPEFSLVPEEGNVQVEKTATSSEQTFPSTNALPTTNVGDTSLLKSLSQHKKCFSSSPFGDFGSLHGRPTSGFGHGRNGPPSQGSSSVFFVNRGVGHGDGSTPHGPSGWGVVRNSWRNLSRLSWTSTQSSPNSNDPIVEEGGGGETERPLTQKSFASMLSSFPRPSTSNTADIFATRPHVIHEASDDEETSNPDIPKPLPRSLPKAKMGSSFRRKKNSSIKSSDRGGSGGGGLQDFHKRRLQQSSQNPLFAAHLSSSSRKSSLHLSRSQSKASIITFDPATPPPPLLPPPPPARSSKSISSPQKRSRINYTFTTRALSPLHRSRSSYASTTTGSSKFSDPVDTDLIAPFYPPPHSGAAGLLLEQEEEGTDNEASNKRWRHLNHPNPLGAHRTNSDAAAGGGGKNSTDVSDAELIESLRAAGQFGAAERLSYLRAQTEGHDDDEDVQVPEVETAVEVRSAKGKKLDHKAGLKSGDSGNKSLRGDIEDAGGSSAFM